MSDVRLTTFNDLVNHVLDYIGGNVSDEQNLRYARRAVLTAYVEVGTSRNWSYLYTPFRVTTVAPQNSSTITYDHTGGTYERMVTLAAGTWPTWAAAGVLVINSVAYNVASRINDTVLTLTSSLNPGADLAAGTQYTLYQDTYTLPGDFRSMDELVNINHVLPLTYQHVADWQIMHRIIRGPATPRIFSITSDPKYFGVMALRLYPAPDNIYQLDSVYQRRPRDLSLDLYDTGTVTTTAGSTVLAGSGTNWTSSMVGTVIRISSTTTPPTGPHGENPAAIERSVVSWSSATSMTLDADPGQTLAGVAYNLSDPADVESGAMQTFLLRESERQMRMIKRMKSTDDEERQYREAVTRAWESDSRSSERRVAGYPSYFYPRLRDMPRGPDVS